MGEPSLMLQQRRSTISEALCGELESVTHRDRIPHKSFICDQDIRRILTHNDEVFSIIACTANERNFLTEHCLQTLAALVLSGAFTAVEHLRDFFFPVDSSEPKIKDRDLWVSSTHDLSPLPYAIRKVFLQCQYLVKPYTISEQDPNKTVELDSNVRLPITYEEPNIGMGGYGKVSEVKVPPQYFVTRGGAVFQEEQVFALKSIRIKKDFLQEVRNLGILKESLTSHDRIIQHHATFIQDDTYHILLPRAEFGDLALFLKEGQGDVGDGQSYHFDTRFPDYRRGNSAHDLLNQTASIADALEWLHYHLRVGGETDLYLIHMDLKPGNILIKRDDARKSTVGTWVLTDFGISVCKEADKDKVSQRTSVVTIRDAYERLDPSSKEESLTHPRRCEGKHQAPEVRSGAERTVGRKSDVWSLACITAEVVAFSLEGKEALAEFEKRRLGDNDQDDYFYLASRGPAQDPTLRPGVQGFLSDLLNNHHECGVWLGHVVRIILGTLKIKASERPSAGEFRTLLRHVRKVLGSARCMREDCPVRQLKGGSQAISPQNADLTLSRSSDDTSLDDGNEGGRARLSSLSTSVLSGSSRSEIERRLSILSRQPSQMSQSSVFSSRTSCSYEDIAICPGNKYVALLSDSEAHISGLDAETGALDLQYTIPLSPTIKWENVELSGAFLALKGRTESYNKVTFFDIPRSEFALPVSDNDALSSLISVAVSSNGMGALVSLGCIHVFDLRGNTARRIANGVFKPLSSDSYFDCARFTASGDTLIGRSYGRGHDALHYWKFDDERNFQHFSFQVPPDRGQGPHISLMPASDLDLSKCIHCLVAKNTDGALDRFLPTCTSNEDSNMFSRARGEVVNAKLAALYQDRFLVTLERQIMRKYKLCCRPVDFCGTPRIGGAKVLEKNLSSEFSFKMVLTQIQERHIVILIARNGATRSIQFNPD